MPTAVAMSRATDSETVPSSHRNSSGTDVVFCTMKITSRTISTIERTTATQAPLVREDRNGSSGSRSGGRRRAAKPAAWPDVGAGRARGLGRRWRHAPNLDLARAETTHPRVRRR